VSVTASRPRRHRRWPTRIPIRPRSRSRSPIRRRTDRGRASERPPPSVRLGGGLSLRARRGASSHKSYEAQAGPRARTPAVRSRPASRPPCPRAGLLRLGPGDPPAGRLKPLASDANRPPRFASRYRESARKILRRLAQSRCCGPPDSSKTWRLFAGLQRGRRRPVRPRGNLRSVQPSVGPHAPSKGAYIRRVRAGLGAMPAGPLSAAGRRSRQEATRSACGSSTAMISPVTVSIGCMPSTVRSRPVLA
jgi:hypothetical protein